MTALQAYAAGWALVPDAPGPGTRHLEHMRSLGGQPSELVIVEAVRDARRAAMERARARLYRKHSKIIAAALLAALGRLNVGHLVGGMLLFGTTSTNKRSRAAWATTLLGAAVVAAPDLYAALQDANAAAWRAASALGRAEAMASTSAGPPDPAAVAKALPDARTAMAAASAPDWTSAQLGWLSWELAADKVVAAPDPEQAARDVLSAGTQVVNATEDAMHQALSGAFVAWWRDSAGTSLGQLWWATEQDDRVCPICIALEGDSPYDASSAPVPPEHPLCRCHLERG